MRSYSINDTALYICRPNVPCPQSIPKYEFFKFKLNISKYLIISLSVCFLCNNYEFLPAHFVNCHIANINFFYIFEGKVSQSSFQGKVSIGNSFTDPVL